MHKGLKAKTLFPAKYLAIPLIVAVGLAVPIVLSTVWEDKLSIWGAIFLTLVVVSVGWAVVAKAWKGDWQWLMGVVIIVSGLVWVVSYYKSRPEQPANHRPHPTAVDESGGGLSFHLRSPIVFSTTNNSGTPGLVETKTFVGPVGEWSPYQLVVKPNHYYSYTVDGEVDIQRYCDQEPFVDGPGIKQPYRKANTGEEAMWRFRSRTDKEVTATFIYSPK